MHGQGSLASRTPVRVWLVRLWSRRKMQVALLRLRWSRACLYEHSGGVGQDHVCAIIADSLMSTSNEMCGGTHHEALLALSVTHARISLPHA